MRGLPLLLLVALAVALPVQALELVVNGDFEEILDVGWEQRTSGTGVNIFRTPSPDPDPDYELQLLKSTGTGQARVSQVIPIPSTDVAFAIDARVMASATSSAWAGAAVIVSYHDAFGSSLGETYISVQSGYCPWRPSPTLHMIPAIPSTWTHHAFNIADELTNLPGVDPDAVRELGISFLVVASDC